MAEELLGEPAVLDDNMLASQYRSQADRLSKEAAELRRQAEELVPTKKAVVKKPVTKKATAKKTVASD